MPAARSTSQEYLHLTEKELQRIVLDIHDGPVQRLFAGLGQLILWRERASARNDLPTDYQQILQRTIWLLENALQEIRDLMTALNTPALCSGSVEEIVQDMILQHEMAGGLPINLQVEQELSLQLPLPQKIVLCRVLQEALSNIRRHSKATSASIKVSLQASNVCLEIEDNGRGFDLVDLEREQTPGVYVHIGLRGMKERLEMVGGHFSIWSRPGAGTRLEVRIPVHEPEEDHTHCAGR